MDIEVPQALIASVAPKRRSILSTSIAGRLTRVAVMIGVLLSATAIGLRAQSVTTTGDVSPSPATSPNWTAGSNLIIGDISTGSLKIEAGGTVSSTGGSIGVKSNSTGEVTVMGANSKWTNWGDMSVGNYGTGTLMIGAGGGVNCQNPYFRSYIGRNSGSNGMVTVTGAGSDWTTLNWVDVGYFGCGTLKVETGGVFNSSGVSIGSRNGSNGTVTVTGAGSVWHTFDSVFVGLAGKGTLSIEAGGVVHGDGLYIDSCIGLSSGSSGMVTVTGTGSAWDIPGRNLTVGDSGTGTLMIGAGGASAVDSA